MIMFEEEVVEENSNEPTKLHDWSENTSDLSVYGPKFDRLKWVISNDYLMLRAKLLANFVRYIVLRKEVYNILKSRSCMDTMKIQWKVYLWFYNEKSIYLWEAVNFNKLNKSNSFSFKVLMWKNKVSTSG